MDVKADIIAWLLKQQDWFQELAERLIQQDDLTDNDLQQVIALLKPPPMDEQKRHTILSQAWHLQSRDLEHSG
ncbi:TPA: hypothetical protein ROS34_004734 [Escherichia coli]|uniref:hypothetical protein n=1 Tax=Escherichia coli TaxID=562 RepID=UPI0002B8DFA4|nr:hypothetical protein [Escherichia coli]EER4144889.1 hypothetical protein [Escherichia coli O6]EES8446896.1 hypothetical protein [Escherichia coli O6:H34]EJC4576522.1 hypothetical protein [Salmonella enterica]ELT1925447.1 hypothetical protein [Shigella sonnei]EAC2024509.1 hypothetical protein [Escherichia coli]